MVSPFTNILYVRFVTVLTHANIGRGVKLFHLSDFVHNMLYRPRDDAILCILIHDRGFTPSILNLFYFLT